ncbi:hypothetical protein D3C81_1123140 [compost metagenome]
MKRLLRISENERHDIGSRDKAILIINGEVLEGTTHAQILNQYLKNKGLQEFEDSRRRPDVDNQTLVDDSYQIGFAHKLNYMKEIWLEINSLKNLSTEEACNLLKQQYPDFPIYNDDADYEYMTYETDGTTLLRA